MVVYINGLGLNQKLCLRTWFFGLYQDIWTQIFEFDPHFMPFSPNLGMDSYPIGDLGIKMDFVPNWACYIHGYSPTKLFYLTYYFMQWTQRGERQQRNKYTIGTIRVLSISLYKESKKKFKLQKHTSCCPVLRDTMWKTESFHCMLEVSHWLCVLNLCTFIFMSFSKFDVTFCIEELIQSVTLEVDPKMQEF